MTPERIAELRAKYAALETLMTAPASAWDRTHMLMACQEAFGAAKTIPSLLDEIERLSEPPPASSSSGAEDAPGGAG